jgi:hypothetical protein
MNEDDHNHKNNSDTDTDFDFGYKTAIAGLLMAALLIIVMFATSGQV